MIDKIQIVDGKRLLFEVTPDRIRELLVSTIRERKRQGGKWEGKMSTKQFIKICTIINGRGQYFLRKQHRLIRMPIGYFSFLKRKRFLGSQVLDRDDFKEFWRKKAEKRKVMTLTMRAQNTRAGNRAVAREREAREEAEAKKE